MEIRRFSMNARYRHSIHTLWASILNGMIPFSRSGQWQDDNGFPLFLLRNHSFFRLFFSVYCFGVDFYFLFFFFFFCTARFQYRFLQVYRVLYPVVVAAVRATLSLGGFLRTRWICRHDHNNCLGTIIYFPERSHKIGGRKVRNGSFPV